MGEKQIIQISIDKVQRLLNEAKLLVENKFFEGAISRLYFAVFHAAKVILFAIGENPRNHDDIITLFATKLIAPHLIDREYAIIFRQLKEKRDSSDFSLMPFFADEEMYEMIGKTEKFFHRMELFLTENHLI